MLCLTVRWHMKKELPVIDLNAPLAKPTPEQFLLRWLKEGDPQQQYLADRQQQLYADMFRKWKEKQK